MHSVTYTFVTDSEETCSWCDEEAHMKIDATPSHLIDFACLDHAADHMRGNADAIDSREPAETV